jgi:hypothetical protein
VEKKAKGKARKRCHSSGSYHLRETAVLFKQDLGRMLPIPSLKRKLSLAAYRRDASRLKETKSRKMVEQL